MADEPDEEPTSQLLSCGEAAIKYSSPEFHLFHRTLHLISCSHPLQAHLQASVQVCQTALPVVWEDCVGLSLILPLVWLLQLSVTLWDRMQELTPCSSCFGWLSR